MKKLYFLLFFAFSFIANAQIVNIPDANFKAALLGANASNIIASTETPVYNGTFWMLSNYHAIDTNNDGQIQVSEAQNIKYLDVSNLNIANLTGIEAFTNLIVLGCLSNQLTSLNITQNLQLESLSLRSNQLTSLNITQNPQLIFLDCYQNQITSLDLTQNTQLQKLYCHFNQLTSLDVSQNLQLIELNCRNNSLESMNIKNGNVASWTTLEFYSNPNLLYICADNEDVDLVQQKIDIYSYNFTCHVNDYCSFVPGGNYFEVSGNTKFDFNINGCDAADLNASNLKLTITDGVDLGNYIANNTGDYNFFVQAGNYTITPNLENPTYFTISPSNFTVDFPTQASPFTQDFCVTSNGVHSDVEISVSPITPARPGFDAVYKIVYKNKGNQVENGSVTLTFDDAVLDYVLSNPVYNSNATNSFTWNYTNLQPFETREIEITFNVNSPMESPAVNIDDILNFNATITTANTDETPADNTFSLNQIVVGSYDPNDKTCLEGETVDVSMVGEYVHYVIRFENTGTYPAENIVVKDMIDMSKFDISTLVPLHGSHEFYTRIKDNKVEFIFENINLDFNDATNDGYVAFKIKTLPSLTVGETFTNDANIYFDYNFPITTNTYTTTVNNVLNNQDFAFENEFTLYPNPTKDILNISSKNQTEIQSVEIYNIVGQIVVAIPNVTKTIDVSNLENGTYFVKVNTQQGSTTSKFIKE